VLFRSIPIQGRKLSAYGLFASFPQHFSAILEDPSGNGRQHLASRAGRHCSLDTVVPKNESDAYFSALKEMLQGSQASPAMRCLLYASYEAGNLLEKLPKPAAQPAGSVFSAFFPDFSVCFDADISVMHLAAKSQDQLDQLLSLIDGEPQKPDTKNIDISHEDINVTSSKEYKNSVRNVREYIASGDIFQANIARFWHANLDADLLPSLYDMLRRVNPAPFSCMARIESKRGVMHLLSASPERLFRMLPDGEVDTRPIAGTRRRGEGDADEILSAELLLSEKERAEHIMLVDLERNDLGRVCQPGSVEVNERMAIERYATVQHIVSNVRGKLAEGRDVIDVFRAMFPGGTITGCPKIRCMEIIHELEQRPRGPYTGSIGYVAWDGSADMNILIRTFWHHDGQLHWAAGAGIVADSDPEHELIETEHKAEGLMRALFTKK